jgi:hypothetical protein
MNEALKYSGFFEIRGFGLSDILGHNNRYIEMLTEHDESFDDTNEDRDDSIDTEHKEVKNKLYEEIFDRVLIKSDWVRFGNTLRLERYINIIASRVKHEQDKNPEALRGNGYVISDDRKTCLFNTGLIDKFNSDIYLLDTTNGEKNIRKKRLHIEQSKATLRRHYGFNSDILLEMPSNVKVYDSSSDLIFSATLDEFDTEDSNRLHHIVSERMSRLPQNCRDLSFDFVCDRIRESVRKAIKLSERDYKYVVPMYSPRYNKIQFLMPLHIHTTVDETPEVALVIGRKDGFYQVFTILNIDMAYENAAVISRPDSSWLKAK